jgi:hypothetical protein
LRGRATRTTPPTAEASPHRHVQPHAPQRASKSLGHALRQFPPIARDFVTALVPSDTACFANSPGNTSRMAVCTSRDSHACGPPAERSSGKPRAVARPRFSRQHARGPRSPATTRPARVPHLAARQRLLLVHLAQLPRLDRHLTKRAQIAVCRTQSSSVLASPHVRGTAHGTNAATRDPTEDTAFSSQSANSEQRAATSVALSKVSVHSVFRIAIDVFVSAIFGCTSRAARARRKSRAAQQAPRAPDRRGPKPRHPRPDCVASTFRHCCTGSTDPFPTFDPNRERS